MNRVDVTITLNLTQELFDQARSAGLLTPEQIERWLINEIERQSKLDHFFGKLDRLANLQPPLTEAEIKAEIDAYRQEKKNKQSPGADL